MQALGIEYLNFPGAGSQVESKRKGDIGGNCGEGQQPWGGGLEWKIRQGWPIGGGGRRRKRFDVAFGEVNSSRREGAALYRETSVCGREGDAFQAHACLDDLQGRQCDV